MDQFSLFRLTNNYFFYLFFLPFFISSCEKNEPEVPDKNQDVTLKPGLLVSIDNIVVNPVFAREGRPVHMDVILFNNESSNQELTVRLILPEHITETNNDTSRQVTIRYSREGSLSFNIISSKTTLSTFTIQVDNGEEYNNKTFALEFRPPFDFIQESYVPVPKISETGDYMVGAFRWPLWFEETRPDCWRPFQQRFYDRVPVLGFYNEADPEVIDWEIKYALESGISFFVDGWYRDPDNVGQSPIVGSLDHWSMNLKKARYRDMIKYAILWANRGDKGSTFANEDDLFENLVPYWIQNYFSESNYLRVEGKPLFVIYSYDEFIQDIGGSERAKAALVKMDQILADAGLNGLYPITVHNLNFRKNITYLKDIGFKSIVSYHVPTFTGEMNLLTPPPQNQIIDIQELCWNKLKNISSLPTYPVVSMGWDSEAWGFFASKTQWVITGNEYKNLCERAKTFAQDLSQGNRIIMLDNWNEFGEGHYISPTQKYGFMHLDAIREVFSPNATGQFHIVPEDIGLGPYEYYQAR